MLPDRVSNPGPLTYESGALPIALCGPAPCKQAVVCPYLWDRVCSMFGGAGKFCLAHGLRQLTHDFKSDVRILNFRSDVTCATTKNTESHS